MLIVLNESGIAKTVTVADCHCNHCHCNHCHCNHRRLYLCWPVQLVGGTETVLNYYPIAGVCRLEVDLKLLSQIQKWWIMTFMCQLDYCHPKTLCMSSVKHTINWKNWHQGISPGNAGPACLATPSHQSSQFLVRGTRGGDGREVLWEMAKNRESLPGGAATLRYWAGISPNLSEGKFCLKLKGGGAFPLLTLSNTLVRNLVVTKFTQRRALVTIFLADKSLH